MEFSKKYTKWLWILAVPFIMVMCYTIEDVMHPTNPQAGDEIEILAKMKLECGATRDNKFVFAILAPKSWNIAQNADLTFSCADLGVVAEKMTPIPEGDKEASSLSWPDAIMRRFGQMDVTDLEKRPDWTHIGGNYGTGVEWVAFESSEQYHVENGENITGEMLIKIKTSNENIKVMMAYLICGKEKGLDDYGYYAKMLEVTGGEGSLIDHTLKPGVINGAVDRITYPAKPTVGPLDLNASIKLNGKDTGISPVTLGILVPKSWNAASNANVYLSTSGYKGGDVSSELMTPMADAALEPATKIPWSEAWMERFGMLGNHDGMEWVTFTSSTVFDIDGASSDITANFRVSLTIDENVKSNIGYAVCGEYYGFDEEYYNSQAGWKLLVTGGGSDPVYDYRKDPGVEYPSHVLMSNVPHVFGYGDIFSVRFDAEADYYEQLASGTEYYQQAWEPRVFMYSRAVLDNGQDIIISRTEMDFVKGSVWQKYIYPPHFFDLPSGAVIKELYFHFANDNNSIVIDDEGVDFFVPEAK